MKEYEKKFYTSEETMKFAEKFAQHLKPGDVIALEGDLGAGKTTFTKGLALGLGVKRTVNSPTFTIIKEYKGRLPLYHMDVYRVEDSYEDLGFAEYFEGEGITVIEWAHLIDEQLPGELLTIFIYHGTAGERRLVFVPKGERYELLCKEIFS
ncbi:tRNA (adenosine(37)-N6)-threonylcarbamoyltransferase complex ATPase subunit type 1 TsaE [Bacillus aquiflavi]|uniref:tRNA threonylcarbamoyladenosine biosynthesis protein TsaE n=1 Tax=Bacillus aquiflavi TaxID=2672567 RepID=A0A6B3W388_9BACI|nr:tRNA (adenosine(37)-N6)-threonylcarbamoyltransferase complex ATPase subunit type 1 TsaE [Bacillus aquiflavi]MBA4538595.1 tRNA (adenosine(37)-N6)-threonylcarbamoyltransferase complex ATPase subunit type 1 TsaE [Bacillus aquiflavi]NEY82957.1 tRNA (adenosine(37)-N6)-threonylcarbamoyltransferase complex ATPase subunit type 1 TsaE [Bacillus aquiflavi]UAC48498.1 tRNA (adenosine(37)-N6)-threonylcarbamoyltransferase complex ATPase subunit type 1 TsaE [Bacillus aquiflavi]